MDNSYLLYSLGASQTQLYTYYSIVLFSFFFLLNKYRKKSFEQYIILMFFSGLMSIIGKYFYNIYYIIRTFLTVYWLDRTKSFQFNRNTSLVIISFFLFTIIFFTAAIVNRDYFNIIFSQYSLYFILFSFFLILMKYRNDGNFQVKLDRLLYDLLKVQIFLSIAKFFIIGATESIVGSISGLGGAVATPLPILGFMFIWIRNKGEFKIKNWWFIAGLVFIGFVSDKRAIIFILPIIIFLFFYYIPKRIPSIKIILIGIIAIPTIFYFGVRLNKSLNPEDKVFGSFDIEYIYNYASKYMFGTEEKTQATGLSYGRGGATSLLYGKLLKREVDPKEWFGFGLRHMFTTSYKEFYDLGFGIHSLGSANGAFQSYVSNGYFGLFAFVIFSFFIIKKTRNKRLRNVLLFFFFWEYFFYTGIIFRFPSLAFLLIYFTVFSKKEFKIKKVG